MLKSHYDEKIQSIIEQGKKQPFDELIRNEDCEEVFCQLSSLRNGLLCWYPFDRSWSCLEIGAGFGSITGTLLGKMRKVDAVESDKLRADCLKVRYGDSPITVHGQFPEGKKYDCIVLTENFTKETDAATILKTARELLEEDGVMLLGYSNRDGMSAVPQEKEKLFSRTEADELIAQTGFTDRYYYYVLPDTLFPQAVYSEKELPDIDSDRFFFNSAFSSVTAAEKKAAYLKALDEGLFEERADYFLAELRIRPHEGPRVVKAYLSCDRDRSRCFAIRFLDNCTVEKLAVYPEGQTALREMYENLNRLKSRGISIVSQELDGNCIRMPFVNEPPLLWYLKEHPKKTEVIFEMLYQNILRSSELSGDVLETGYIDMVPFNCFYDEGRLIYYDQEFTEAHCPVNYIMFRAIFYTYIHVPELEEHVPIERLKEKYDVCRQWDEYNAKEARFVSGCRNRDLYYRFWR